MYILFYAQKVKFCFLYVNTLSFDFGVLQEETVQIPTGTVQMGMGMLPLNDIKNVPKIVTKSIIKGKRLSPLNLKHAPRSLSRVAHIQYINELL